MAMSTDVLMRPGALIEHAGQVGEQAAEIRRIMAMTTPLSAGAYGLVGRFLAEGIIASDNKLSGMIAGLANDLSCHADGVNGTASASTKHDSGVASRFNGMHRDSTAPAAAAPSAVLGGGSAAERAGSGPPGRGSGGGSSSGDSDGHSGQQKSTTGPHPAAGIDSRSAAGLAGGYVPGSITSALEPSGSGWLDRPAGESGSAFDPTGGNSAGRSGAEPPCVCGQSGHDEHTTGGHHRPTHRHKHHRHKHHKHRPQHDCAHRSDGNGAHR